MPVSLLLEALPGLSTVWRADEMARSKGAVIVTGSALLDAQLPGGGWPVGAVVEILQEGSSIGADGEAQGGAHGRAQAGARGKVQGGVHGNANGSHCEWRLLLPALVRVTRASPAALVLVGAPHAPFAPALAGQGLDPHRLLCIDTAPSASRLWATEQALRCKDVAAVLAWLPQARADQLRRLQMAAAEHSKLLFVMRPAQARGESSPAVLRLLASTQPGSDALLLHILKRRGPPLDQPLLLPGRPARLAALLAVCNGGGGGDEANAAGTQAAPAMVATPKIAKISKITEISAGAGEVGLKGSTGREGLTDLKGVAGHALDRIAAAA